MTPLLADVVEVFGRCYDVPAEHRPAFTLTVQKAIESGDPFEAHDRMAEALLLMRQPVPATASVLLWELVKRTAVWRAGAEA